jgi:hypothetical protein
MGRQQNIKNYPAKHASFCVAIAGLRFTATARSAAKVGLMR